MPESMSGSGKLLKGNKKGRFKAFFMLLLRISLNYKESFYNLLLNISVLVLVEVD